MPRTGIMSAGLSKNPKKHVVSGSVERGVKTKTAEEFLDTLSPSGGNWNGTPEDWIFRGIEDSDYFLIPSALRNNPPPLSYTTPKKQKISNHKKQVEAEFGLLWRFFVVADSQGLLVPEDSQIYRSPEAYEKIISKNLENAKNGTGQWPFDELLSLAALAQHHGVATRLLDWSRDPFAAAYFAAVKASERFDRITQGCCIKCGCVLGTLQSCFNCGSPRVIDPDKLHLAVWCLNWYYVMKRWPGEDPQKIDVLLVTAPRATNPNLNAQGGVFTLHIVRPGSPRAQINRDRLDDLIERTAKPRKDEEKGKQIKFPVMLQVLLQIKHASRLLRLLAMQNIHAASIHPGFDGVVKHLEEWRLWDKPPREELLPPIR